MTLEPIILSDEQRQELLAEQTQLESALREINERIMEIEKKYANAVQFFQKQRPNCIDFMLHTDHRNPEWNVKCLKTEMKYIELGEKIVGKDINLYLSAMIRPSTKRIDLQTKLEVVSFLLNGSMLDQNFRSNRNH